MGTEITEAIVSIRLGSEKMNMFCIVFICLAIRLSLMSGFLGGLVLSNMGMGIRVISNFVISGSVFRHFHTHSVMLNVMNGRRMRSDSLGIMSDYIKVYGVHAISCGASGIYVSFLKGYKTVLRITIFISRSNIYILSLATVRREVYTSSALYIIQGFDIDVSIVLVGVLG